MSLRVKKSTKQRHLVQVKREPYKRIFIVCEGDRTEVKYFEGIKNNSKELGINDLLEIVLMEKDLESKGKSDLNGLVMLANQKIEEYECGGIYDNIGTYDKERDKFLIVFDRDKESCLNYLQFIDKYKDEFILGITNPCFELWLLLHKENSVERIVKPNYKDILENGRVSSNHTFISKLVSDEFHMNSKTGMRFSKFKKTVHYAIEQEKNLEQDLYKLENTVGSNIGQIIASMML